MRTPRGLMAGGLAAGLAIVAGEALLNLWLLAPDWAALLPQPGPAEAVQGIVKLLLLGLFGVWLADVFTARFPSPDRSALLAGFCVWLLVWAWVQWGLLLAGFVTPRIAGITAAWGLVELPLAVWMGVRLGRWWRER